MYKKHVFVCHNIRNSPNKKSCGKMGIQIRNKLKKEIIDNNLKDKIRINKSGCLGKCEDGSCLVIYPEGLWRFNLKLEECEDIVNKLILK